MHQALICHGSHHGEGCLKNPPLQRTPRQQLGRESGQLKQVKSSQVANPHNAFCIVQRTSSKAKRNAFCIIVVFFPAAPPACAGRADCI